MLMLKTYPQLYPQMVKCVLYLSSINAASLISIYQLLIFLRPIWILFCFLLSPFNLILHVFLALLAPVLLIGLLLLALLQRFSVVRFNIDSRLSC